MIEEEGTNESSVRIVRVINSALEEVLVEPGDVVVSLDLSVHVVAVEGEGANVLLHLLEGPHRLHHLGSLVQHLRAHGQWLARSR